MNHHRHKVNGKDKEGIAFGETVLMSSPPSRSQIEGKSESGFGGWADEKIKTAREAAPNLGRKKSHPQHLTIARIFYTSVAEIERNPLAWRKVYKDFRRCLLKRFPYAVYYTAAKKDILIYGVIHGARNTVFTKTLLGNR